MFILLLAQAKNQNIPENPNKDIELISRQLNQERFSDRVPMKTGKSCGWG